MLTRTEEESNLKKRGTRGIKTERLERRVLMSSARERRGQKQRRGRWEKDEPEQKPGPVLCPTLLKLSYRVY